MKRNLRQRIVLLTLIPLLLAMASALVVVDRQVRGRSRERLGEELRVADRVLRNVLATRRDDIEMRAGIVARDPKFFALLSIPAEERTGEFRPTIAAIARDFGRATGADLLEIYDTEGHHVADAGEGVPGAGPDAPVRGAERDSARARTMVRDGRIIQVATVPVLAGGQPVGILRYGEDIDAGLARRVRDLAGADVTFRLDGAVVATSGGGDDRALRLEGALPDLDDPGRATYMLSVSREPELRFLASVRWSLVALGVVFALFAAGIAHWLGARITSPVTQLLRASERLEQGDYEAPIAVHTGDELEALATTFDGMRQSLHRQIETLATLDRMKSDFLDLASHELRTPASVLRGCVDLMVAAPPVEMRPGGALSELLESLSESSQHLSRIVEQITDMSLLDRRQMELAMRPVDLGSLAREAAEARRGDAASRNLALDVSTAGEVLPMIADARRIRQVIDNLLLNAIRFTPDGGAITVRAGGDGDEVYCAVEDTGMGIAPEIQGRIFEPLFEGRDILGHSSGTTEFDSAGLGTGLAISRRIVEVHGGRIAVASAPGAGSRFMVTFPRAAEGLAGVATGEPAGIWLA